MADLIDRQAAIAHAISGRTREFGGDKWIRVSEVRENLQTMPSAEPEPKTGRWKKTGAYPHKVYCSVCYATYVPNSELESWSMKKDSFWKLPRNYCPNCGAKMEGEDNG